MNSAIYKEKTVKPLQIAGFCQHLSETAHAVFYQLVYAGMDWYNPVFPGSSLYTALKILVFQMDIQCLVCGNAISSCLVCGKHCKSLKPIIYVADGV